MIAIVIMPKDAFATESRSNNIEKVLLGDINEDNVINTSDMLLMLRHIEAQNNKGKHDNWLLTGRKALIADVTQNGTIDLSDRLVLLRYITAKRDSNIASQYPKWLELEQKVVEFNKDNSQKTKSTTNTTSTSTTVTKPTTNTTSTSTTVTKPTTNTTSTSTTVTKPTNNTTSTSTTATKPTTNTTSTSTAVTMPTNNTTQKEPTVEYQLHIQGDGWEKAWAKNGAQAGSTGQSKRAEAIKIKISDNSKLNVEYRTHVQTAGWDKSWTKNGEIAGTTGQSKRLEAIQIKLTGEDASKYDIYYCTHSSGYGWLNWAKNGEVAGTTGIARAIEAIQIKIVKKSEKVPDNAEKRAYVSLPEVKYQAYMQTEGWQKAWGQNGTTAGITGQSKRLEALKIEKVNTNGTDMRGDIEYRAHLQGSGWDKEWRKNGAIVGTTGQSRRLEAIQIKLTGELEKYCDIYYRAHVQKYGWLGWVKNGEVAGSTGIGYRMEAIQIMLVMKGTQSNDKTKGLVTEPFDTINVLFIGNSKTFVNDANARFQNLANAAGKNVHAERTPAYGGKTLYELSTYDSIKNQIRSKKWDYIVLQEQTDTSEYNLDYIIQGCNNLINYTKNNSNKNVTPIYNATWIVDSAGQSRQNTLNNNFNEAKKRFGGKIAYSGNAFLNCRSQYPHISLYEDDRHPTVAGQYLSACCVYAAIYGKSPVGIPATDVSPVVAGNLQQVAARTMGV